MQSKVRSAATTILECGIYSSAASAPLPCSCYVPVFGYDRKDEIAGILFSIFALGVAFFPTKPDVGATSVQKQVGWVHYTFAALLFFTLAYFCLVLFKMTAKDKVVTPQKEKRNVVYTVCGWVIIASIALIVLFNFVLKIDHLIGTIGPVFCFETTSLLAFGLAWLVKGETFLKDQMPQTEKTETNGRSSADGAT